MRPELGALALMIAAPVGAGPLFAPVEAPDHSYAGGWEHFVGGGLASLDRNRRRRRRR